MYIFASSEDSEKWYLPVNGADFTICLPKQLDLDDKWQCCLKELRITRKPLLQGLFYVHSDIIESSIVAGTETGVLRVIDLEAKVGIVPVTDRFTYQDGYYFALNKRQLDRIHISIKDSKLWRVSGITKLHCVLHLKRKDG